MGDAGSTYLGFTFASMLLFGASHGSALPILVLPLALSPFLLDGTFTIFRRLKNREKVWQAHRSHLYQRAVQAGRTHREVLVPYAAWCVGGLACSVAAAGGDGRYVAGATFTMLLALALVFRWVSRLEAARPPPAP
jgi:UDP-N-acetylmuramyl pentapeptide phosphotransferase/UDP-N-acetylglucosamine-1-phosphate transferase